MRPSFTYKAIVERVVDGDSVVLTIDCGFKLYYKHTIRMSGINTPELNSADETERLKARQARDYVSTMLPVGKEIIFESRTLDLYGRPLGVIWLGDVNLNELLIREGFAVKY